MKRNYVKEFNDARRQAKEIVTECGTHSGHTLYLSFSKYGMQVFERLNQKMYDDAIVDFELEVISEEEKTIILDTYSLIKNSIAVGIVY